MGNSGRVAHGTFSFCFENLSDDSLPGWANGNSVGQNEPAQPYQEAFRDPGAMYDDNCHEYEEYVFPVASFETFHVEV